MRYLALLFALPLAAQVIISPAQPAATESQAITLTATGCGTGCTFSLSGGGALSSATATTVVYTAPASTVPNATMLGCPVLPNDAVFNTRIDALPVDANSGTWLTAGNFSSLGISFLPAWGITYADNSTPTFNLIPYYGDNAGGQPVYSTPMPTRNLIKRENGAFNSGTYTGNDHHTVTVNKSTCQFYEYYNEFTPALLPLVACRYSGSNCNESSEIPPYPSTNYAIPNSSTDAAGLPLAPLTWTLADIEAGPKHAVRFTTARGYINGFEWPANTANETHSGSAPYGARVRVKAAYNIATACGANALCTNMLTGMKQYGGVLADIGGGNQFQVSMDAWMDPVARSAMNLIQTANVVGTSLEFVDESSLKQTTGNHFQVPTNGSYAVDPANGFVAPANYAVVTATPSAGAATKVSVALQGVGIGLPYAALPIAAGVTNYAFPAWVTPAGASQTVNWAITSCSAGGGNCGSISGNLYTPPSSVSALTTAVLTGIAVADSNVTINLPVSILSNNSGTYSIDIASAVQTTSPGKVWNFDFGLETSSPAVALSADYPTWQHPWGINIPEYVQYDSYLYTYGGDFRYCAAVPNGNYRVRWMQGQAWNSGSFPQGSFPQNVWQTPEMVSAQGIVAANYYDYNWAAGFQYATPQDIYIPARVTNQLLCTSIGSVTSDPVITAASGIGPLYPGTFAHFAPLNGYSKSNIAEGLEIIPDATTAHWSLDAQGVNTIPSGGYTQLFVVDWYTGDADVSTPTWSVTGPAGVSISNGLLHFAPGGSFLSGQPITVTATGMSHSASITIYTSGGSGYLLN